MMNEEKLYRILKRSHVTEKGNRLLSSRQYVFHVDPAATKPEVKQAIEFLYKVKVQSVNVLNAPPRRVRTGRIEGMRKRWKKAFVTLQVGHSIELFHDAA